MARLRRFEKQLDDRRELRDADEFAPIPYRVYTVDDAGQRVFAEPDEDDRAVMERYNPRASTPAFACWPASAARS